MNVSAGQQGRCRHRKQTCGHSGGRRGRDELREQQETHILPYVKQIASGNSLCDAGSPKLVLCDNLEGWDGEGGGRRAQGAGDIGIPLADSC